MYVFAGLCAYLYVSLCMWECVSVYICTYMYVIVKMCVHMCVFVCSEVLLGGKSFCHFKLTGSCWIFKPVFIIMLVWVESPSTPWASWAATAELRTFWRNARRTNISMSKMKSYFHSLITELWTDDDYCQKWGRKGVKLKKHVYVSSIKNVHQIIHLRGKV